jgi:dihydrofolate reductase
MTLYHAVAAANGRVIGKNNRLPWHFSSDLKFFKALTWGETVLMGRKTYESIGKPLPGRQNFVLSRDLKISPPPPGVRFFASLAEAVSRIETPKGFIIGGASVYAQSFSLIDGIYLTRIEADYEGDAFYPEIPPAFIETRRELLQENPKISVIFYKKSAP